MKGQAAQTPQHLQKVAQQLMATQKARSSASKYDFVKVCMASLAKTVSSGLQTTYPPFTLATYPFCVLPGKGLGGRKPGALLRPLAFSHQSHAHSHQDTPDEGDTFLNTYLLLPRHY